MKLLTASIIILGATLFLGACSGGSNSINSPQIGSSSLLVNAEVIGLDAGSGTFTTSLKVTIADVNDLPINDATVTITHAVHGVTQLLRDTLTAGSYTASVDTYEAGVYTLNISRGSDYLSNVTVTGPDIHQITFPTLTDTIPLNSGFTATWTRAVASDEVEVETRDYGPALSSTIGDGDDGTYAIPASSTIRDDQRVRITRINSVTPVGALSGSTFKASIRNTVEPLVVR